MHTLANSMQSNNLHRQLWVSFFQVSKAFNCFRDLWKLDLCVSFINISNEQADLFNHWNLATKHSARFSSVSATSLKSMACLAGIQGRIWTIINNWNPNKETQKSNFTSEAHYARVIVNRNNPTPRKNELFTVCYFCIGLYCLN